VQGQLRLAKLTTHPGEKVLLQYNVETLASLIPHSYIAAIISQGVPNRMVNRTPQFKWNWIGMTDTTSSKPENDLTVLAGTDSLQCHRFVATGFSPHIGQLHSTDSDHSH
jgi:hypothetical protein